MICIFCGSSSYKEFSGYRIPKGSKERVETKWHLVDIDKNKKQWVECLIRGNS